MLSLFLLIVGSVIVLMFWTENYGDTTVDVYNTFLNATEVLKNGMKASEDGAKKDCNDYTTMTIMMIITTITDYLPADTKITVLGLTQSLFEASMYTFVFMWTPALSEGDDTEPLPFGLIFACYIYSMQFGIPIQSNIKQKHKLTL